MAASLRDEISQIFLELIQIIVYLQPTFQEQQFK